MRIRRLTSARAGLGLMPWAVIAGGRPVTAQEVATPFSTINAAAAAAAVTVYPLVPTSCRLWRPSSITKPHAAQQIPGDRRLARRRLGLA